MLLMRRCQSELETLITAAGALHAPAQPEGQRHYRMALKLYNNKFIYFKSLTFAGRFCLWLLLRFMALTVKPRALRRAAGVL